MRVSAIAGLALLLVTTLAGSEEAPLAGLIADLPFLDGGEATAILIDLAPPGDARALPLLLDTGASQSVMTPRMARALGVSVRRNRSTPYRRATRLGRDLRFWIDTSSSDTGAPTGFEYGLLGGEFLAHYVVEIDYAARRVRFFDPEQVRVPEQDPAPGACVVPLRLVAHRPLLEVQVGTRPVSVLLDTGSPFGLLLGRRAAARSGIESRPVHGLTAHGVRGPIALELGAVDTIQLGRFALSEHPVLVAPRGLYQQAGASDSVLGHDLLASYRVRIDYPRRRLGLQRQAPPGARLLGESWAQVKASGVGLVVADTAVAVRFVFPDSAGARLGLQPGDVIALAGRSPAELREQISAAGPITVERLDAAGEPFRRVLGAQPPPEPASGAAGSRTAAP